MPLLLRRRSHLDLPKSTHPAASSSESLAGHDLSSDAVNLAVPGTLGRPGSSHGAHPHSRLSHEVQPDDISDSTSTAPSKRFSIMRFRNLSESHLAGRAKPGAVPPLPTMASENVVPSILKTAPTMEDRRHEAVRVETVSGERPPRFTRTSSNRSKSEQKSARKSMDERRSDKKASSLRWRRSKHDGLEDLHRLSTLHLSGSHASPPAYGDDSTSALAIPLPPFAKPRYSESSQSEGSNASSGDGPIYGSTTTTTHTVSTHTTFFKLPGRNKNRASLFPLPAKPALASDGRQSSDQLDDPATPRPAEHGPVPRSFTPDPQSPPTTVLAPGTLRRRYTETSPTKRRTHFQAPPPPVPSPHAALAKGALSFAEPGMNLFRNSSTRSRSSSRSSPLHLPLQTRDRASTTSSFGLQSDIDTPPPRNSTSTTGRSSFGTLLHLSRFRQGSEPYSPRHGSPGGRSKSNSFAVSREALVIPEREEGDTPGKYLERLEAAVSRSLIAGILSKSPDPFAQAVLRSYTRRFPFFTEPIDMSLRKFLLEAELPKETQQVDRVIQAFADRYHECNPGIFTAPDQAYVIAFSIMMLHTDAFNKNNKRKMQKPDYIKNTSGQGISDDVLACFYDNICYTPFVHFEEEVDINGERVLPFQPKKSQGKLKSAIPGADVVTKRPTGPVDPYNLLVDQKLDQLRPSIKDSITMDDPYSYLGSQGELDIHYLQRAFTHTGVLQIISARSRPAAYERQEGTGHPDPTDTQQGIVDLKITKVGTLWRKAAKRRKARSPWQEWGAILTGSQLYLFKNAHWAKGLLHQFTSQQKHGLPRMPVIFKPPLHEFKPDALIKTDNAVALIDATYVRHKNAFTFVRPGGQEETLLADSESELNDWLGLINYAAAFRAAGVRIRGMLGGNEDDPRKDVRRLNSANSAHSIQTKMGEVTVHNRGITPQLQRQVMAARRQIMVQKVGEIEREFIDANRQLDGMLRNARHLLVLAPISPRTREDVIHAAAKADANIKWLRRDIWRMKCHRDILAMDVRLDGFSASELEKFAHEQAEKHPEHESAKKEKRGVLARLHSSKAQRSPPQSPTLERPAVVGSGENFFNNDVFRTPPETTTQQQGSEPWRLPPVNFNSAEQLEHRPSIASTLLSVTPSQGGHSLSYASSASSVLQVEPVESIVSSEQAPQDGDGRLTPVPTIEEKELQMLARATMTPEPPTELRGANLDGAPPASTPDSKHRTSVRRSLQKTLREAHHHHHHSSHSHRHRRGKDSDSTVRSAAAATDDREQEEITPGLARDKPRFILHGKQASVVQFGGDWERMKLRREQYARDHSTANAAAEPNSTPFPDHFDRSGAVSPVIHDLHRSPGSRDDDHDDDFDDAQSFTSAGTPSLREDAEAAAALASESPKSGVKRTTVIGPSMSPGSNAATAEWVLQHRTFSGLQKGEDGTVRLVDETDEDEDDEDHAGEVGSPARKRENRTTVLGSPVQFRNTQRNMSVAAGAEADTRTEVDDDDEEVNEDEHAHSGEAAIADADLRRLSVMPAIPGAW